MPVELDGRPWFWQFSPYGYFNEHGICVNREHTPMRVDRATLVELLDFVDQFPGYFLGCNAALPRIGGSVLAHDHFQGGGETLPMQVAPALAEMRVPGVEDLVVEVLDWPASAVRLVSRSREAIVEAGERLRAGWCAYRDPELGIEPTGPDGAVQSSVSPSVRVTDRGYEMCVILRNNAVSDEYPLGVFHAHPEYFFIKQEPIGLIEAQGLFVLPGRLVSQLDALEEAVLRGELPPDLEAFRLSYDEVREALAGETPDAVRARVREAVRAEVASICRRILGNVAVFPSPEALIAFLESLGWHLA
ncbi:MAG: hypothetical protein UHD09_08775 [Bifidobacterium sp.]|nr:hypothetical protein [Bifidobacterium sp.]